MQNPDTVVPPFLTRDQWDVRPALVGDVAFIIDSWCADENVNVSRLSGEDPEIFKVGMRKRILQLLSSCKCAVVRPTPAYFSAHVVEPDPKKLFGWVLYTLDRATLRPVIHFIYVKPTFRRHGLADALLWEAGVRPERGSWCTTMRLRLRKSLESRGIVYNRFLLDYEPAALPPKQDPYR
jgi:GNAT superfamily N-acetyltransferase